ANGMMVVAPAGDDGGDGVWMVSDTGLGESASSVASVDNNYGRYPSFTYADISRPYSSFVAINPAPIAILPLFNFFDGKLADGCQPSQYNQVDVDGKFVLVTGNNIHCSMELRAFFAQDAGAAGIIIQTTPFGIAPVPDLDNQDFPVGDFSKMPIQDVSFGFPFPVVNGRDPNGLLSKTPPGTSFDLRGPVNELVPVVLTREGSPTPRLTIRVYDSQNVFKGYLYSPDLGLADIAMGRDRNWWKPNYFSLQRWSWLGDVLPEGTSTLLSLPSESYRLEVASQRKFTAGLYPQDYEIFDLGTYNILTNNGPQQPFK
ncbi:hypothetical protein BGZ99_008902, partial [Dissophora globulifera]